MCRACSGFHKMVPKCARILNHGVLSVVDFKSEDKLSVQGHHPPPKLTESQYLYMQVEKKKKKKRGCSVYVPKLL